MLQIFVNGERRKVGKDITVSRLLEEMETRPDRVAIELNLRILEKAEYSRTVLNDGDRLEIIAFVGGGSRRTYDGDV